MARKQSSTIFFKGLKHKEIYYRGFYHDKMYKASELVWEKLLDEYVFNPQKYLSNRNMICAIGKAGKLKDGVYVWSSSTCICQYNRELDNWKFLFYLPYISDFNSNRCMLCDEGFLFLDMNKGEYSSLYDFKGNVQYFSGTTNFIFKGKGYCLGNLGDVILQGVSAYGTNVPSNMNKNSCEYVLRRIQYDYRGNPTYYYFNRKVIDIGYDISDLYGNVFTQSIVDSEDEYIYCYLLLEKDVIEYSKVDDSDTKRNSKFYHKITVAKIKMKQDGYIYDNVEIVSSKKFLEKTITEELNRYGMWIPIETEIPQYAFVSIDENMYSNGYENHCIGINRYVSKNVTEKFIYDINLNELYKIENLDSYFRENCLQYIDSSRYVNIAIKKEYLKEDEYYIRNNGKAEVMKIKNVTESNKGMLEPLKRNDNYSEYALNYDSDSIYFACYKIDDEGNWNYNPKQIYKPVVELKV